MTHDLRHSRAVHTAIGALAVAIVFFLALLFFGVVGQSAFAAGGSDSSSSSGSSDGASGDSGTDDGGSGISPYVWCEDGVWKANAPVRWTPPTDPAVCGNYMCSLSLQWQDADVAAIYWTGSDGYNPMEHWSVDGVTQPGSMAVLQEVDFSSFGTGTHTVRIWSDPGAVVGTYCKAWIPQYGSGEDASTIVGYTCVETATAYNNYSCSTSYTRAALPDLQSSNIAISGGATSLTSTSSVTFTATASNVSSVDVGSFSDTFAFSYGGQGGSFTNINTIAVSSLAASTSRTDTSSSILFATAGTVTIKHCVDSTDGITESNETNNCSYRDYEVGDPPVEVSCSASPDPAETNETVTWTAIASGGNGTLSYAWTGTNGLSGNGNPITKSYATEGEKNASVNVTDALGLQSGWTACDSLLVDDEGASQLTADLTGRIRNGGGSWVDGPIELESGDEVELRWQSTHADDCNGDAYYSTGGSTSGNTSTVSEPAVGTPRTYTLECEDDEDSVDDTFSITWGGAGIPTLDVDPERVRQGETTRVYGNLNGAIGCTIEGGTDSFSPSNGTSSFSYTSDPILGETVYTLTCTSGGTAEATVRLLPGFEEF